MGKRVLSVSWLSGNLKAAAMNGRHVTGTWASPHRIDAVAGIGEALREAIAQTFFEGDHVVFILDHRQLVYHLQEIPPAKAGLRQRLINRLVVQNRFFDEDAVWGASDLPRLRGVNRVLLNVAPRSLIQGIAAACDENRLRLRGIFPVTAVLQQRLRTSSVAKQEPILFVTAVENNLCLVAAAEGAQFLFARTLTGTGAPQLERVEQEIKRTLLFIQQQFGVTISAVTLQGAALSALFPSGQRREGWTPLAQQEPEDPFCFVREVGSLPGRNPTNLRVESAAASTARHWRQPLAMAASILLLMAVGATMVAECLLHARRLQLSSLAARLELQQNQETMTAGLRRELEQLRRLTEKAEKPAHKPFPTVFLRHLGVVLPDGLTLSTLQMERSPSSWLISLQGTSTNSDLAMAPQWQQLEAGLTNAPFAARITNGVQQFLLASKPAGRNGAALAASGQRGFYVEGEIP